MACRVCSLNSNLTGRPVFFLSDRCAIRRVAAGGDILDPDCDNVTATKLAVDRQIEHGKVASAAFDLEFRPDRPDVILVAAAALPRSACLCSKARACGASGQRSLHLAWSHSSVTETEERGPMVEPLESGQLLDHCGLGVQRR